MLIPLIEKPRSIVWRTTEFEVSDGRTKNVKVVQTTMNRIDLRENVFDLPLQSVITRDNIELLVHPMMLYHIHDPVRFCYEIYDASWAIQKLVQTNIRSIIGDMGLDDTLASRIEINRILFQKIRHILYDWGIQLKSVEVLEILPSSTIQDAMHKQLAAERVRRANITSAAGNRQQKQTEAEGASQAKIATSRGEQQVNVIRTQGLAESKVILAKAEAEAIRVVGDVLKNSKMTPAEYLIGIKYLDSLQMLSASAAGRQVYLPVNTEIMGAVHNLGDYK